MAADSNGGDRLRHEHLTAVNEVAAGEAWR